MQGTQVSEAIEKKTAKIKTKRLPKIHPVLPLKTPEVVATENQISAKAEAVSKQADAVAKRVKHSAAVAKQALAKADDAKKNMQDAQEKTNQLIRTKIEVGNQVSKLKEEEMVEGAKQALLKDKQELNKHPVKKHTEKVEVDKKHTKKVEVDVSWDVRPHVANAL